MSLFTRSYNRFTGGGTGSVRNEQNITHRKKISAVSTSINGDDGMVAASPRNRQPTSFRHQLPPRDEIDGAGMSAMTGAVTPVEKKAAELRKMEKKNHAAAIECAPLPPSLPQSGSSTVSSSKKPRTSTSSLASVFRSRASSPIEKMRKFIGRSSSKSTIQKMEKEEEIEQLKEQLRLLEVQKVDRSQQCDRVTVDVGIMTEALSGEHKNEQIEMRSLTPESVDKENVNPAQKQNINASPDIICLDEQLDKKTIENLQIELAELRQQYDEQKEDFRRTRRDFITILREAVRRKDEAEQLYEKLTKSIAEEEDWTPLMSQNRHTVRRTALLTWAQKKLEPYVDEMPIGNFSSDWTDGRAFCALIYEMFPHLMPDVTVSPIVGDCVARCRNAFNALELRFDERALGLTGADSTDDSSTISSSICLPDWRYVMDTVFEIYKRGNRF